MPIPSKTWWMVGKFALTLAILVCVTWQFAHILSDPALRAVDFNIRVPWIILSAVLYLLALIFPALFWNGLLRALGERPTVPATLRAYYIGQLGRYVPGKFVGIILRANLLKEFGIRNRLAVLTIIYESLTTLSSGALLAGIVLTWQASGSAPPHWKTLGLMLLLLIPTFPGVFNRLVGKLAPPVDGNREEVPRINVLTLLGGLAAGAACWVMQGVSLWALLNAILPEPIAFAWSNEVAYGAFVGLATVAGFVILLAPGGLGVRELVLQQLLATQLTAELGAERAAIYSVIAVLMLRIVWSVAELATAGLLYVIGRFLRGRLLIEQTSSAEHKTAAASPPPSSRHRVCLPL